MREAYEGVWLVVVTSGPWKILNKLGDVKHIDGRAGFNVALGGTWGWFSIEDFGSHIVLDYSDERNPVELRPVRDKLWPTRIGWKGALYFSGLPVFQFRLEPVAAEDTSQAPTASEEGKE